ncbi:sulfite oxidase [Actinomycetospora endophytica]|uniref:Sulfite oxidase n=1 Tax=Actinomycetospora endophytica TaxID=2291215 RepID=A0ABS8P957_9PSEU|nr:sulfite oxidase [Actinomycetospora endophytica]MCD2194789.1 sulfite oxidase [Actinomycetospora endophytica]
MTITKRADMVVHEQEPYNAEPPRGALAGEAITPIESFYGRNHGRMPTTDPDTWRLVVDGLVDRALTLSLEELQTRFEAHEVVATLQCAGNRRAGLLAVRDIPGQHPWGPAATSTARWRGARLADVLAAAGLRSDASEIAFLAPDVAPEAQPPAPYGGSISTDKAVSGEVLLAWQMNGQPLPDAHGAPVRVVVPGWIGARSVKWIERITAQDHPSDNFFQQSAYRLLPPENDDPAPGDGVALTAVALNSEILRPDDQAVLPAGPVEISGYAYAGGDRDVVRVDVSVDGGRSWAQADLDRRLGRWAWRLWHTTVTLPAGQHQIVARAWDSTAALQPEHAASLWNPKGYINNAWPSITVSIHP